MKNLTDPGECPTTDEDRVDKFSAPLLRTSIWVQPSTIVNKKKGALTETVTRKSRTVKLEPHSARCPTS
jgi:hypothetical protein